MQLCDNLEQYCTVVEVLELAGRMCPVHCEMRWVYYVRTALVNARSPAARSEGGGHKMPGCAINRSAAFLI